MPPFCLKCGKPLPPPAPDLIAANLVCPACHDGHLLFTAARSLYLYRPPLSDWLKYAKYRHGKFLIRTLAAWLAASHLPADPLFGDVELVTWPPIRGRHFRRRRFDQAQILAEAVATRMTIPVAKVMRWRHEPPPQAGRNRAERLTQLHGAMAVDHRDLIRKFHAVMVVDDVMTTGATLGECARVLKTAGVRRVYGLTLATTVPPDG